MPLGRWPVLEITGIDQRLQNAAKHRLAAGQSRRPRPRQNRIGIEAARRDACVLSRVSAVLQPLAVVTMPGIVH
ncbi:hypothetical protein AB0O68_30590 [Streptomyces sp. NPDC087512]|uniref:hypothetical protein n=1 Tax=Streptomyces sp. NPDC087512 TaxID=3155059 RepID=UPI0034422FFB